MDKSGVACQIIAVPDGGGALRGIGETFRPDLQTAQQLQPLRSTVDELRGHAPTQVEHVSSA
jgi:hypothetical protein